MMCDHMGLKSQVSFPSLLLVFHAEACACEVDQNFLKLLPVLSPAGEAPAFLLEGSPCGSE